MTEKLKCKSWKFFKSKQSTNQLAWDLLKEQVSSLTWTLSCLKGKKVWRENIPIYSFFGGDVRELRFA